MTASTSFSLSTRIKKCLSRREKTFPEKESETLLVLPSVKTSNSSVGISTNPNRYKNKVRTITMSDFVSNSLIKTEPNDEETLFDSESDEELIVKKKKSIQTNENFREELPKSATQLKQTFLSDVPSGLITSTNDSNRSPGDNEDDVRSNLKRLKITKKPMYCKYCKKSFNNVMGFRLHCNFHCPKRGISKLVCKMCSNSYAGPFALKIHMLNIHNVKISFTEAACAEKVNSKREYSDIENTSKGPCFSKTFKPKFKVNSPKHCNIKSSQNADIYVDNAEDSKDSSKIEEIKNERASSVSQQKIPHNDSTPRSLKAKNPVQTLHATKLLNFLIQSGFSWSSSVCPICRKYVYSSSFLKIHMRKHTNEKPFHCRKCGRRFFSKVAMKYHVIAKCPKRTVIPEKMNSSSSQRNITPRSKKCVRQSSNKAFDYSDFYSNHENDNKTFSDSDTEYSRSTTKSNSRQNGENSHEFTSRKNNKGFSDNSYSDDNSSQFTSSESTEEKQKHRNVNNRFKCAKCEKVFNNKQLFVDHETVHSGKLCYCCENCQRRFQHYHIYRKHTHSCKVKPVKNRDDNSVFRNNAGTSSTQVSAPRKNNNVVKSSTLKTQKLEVVCGICFRVSPWPSIMKIHSEECHRKLDLICKTCNGRFTDYQRLINHLKLKQQKGKRRGRPSYYCDQSENNQRQDNREEIEIHDSSRDSCLSEVDTDTCKVCNKKFPSPQLLIEHLQEHLTMLE